MPFVPVPRDLTKIKTKIAMGLTKRQLICFGTAVAIGVPTFFLARGTVGNSPAVLLMIGVMLPAFFVAMYERDGQPAERILRNMIRSRWLFPQTRPYQTENFYAAIGKEAKLDQKNQAARKASVTKRPRGKYQPKRLQSRKDRRKER